MFQVIQGNNLRCLFTDTPPSLQQAYPRMSRSSLSLYDDGGGGSPGPCPGPYAAYAQHQYPQLPAQQLPQQTLHHGRGVGGHDECKDHSPVARANRHYATTIRPCRPASTTSPTIIHVSLYSSTFSRIVLVPLRCVLWLALYVYKTRTLVLPM